MATQSKPPKTVGHLAIVVALMLWQWEALAGLMGPGEGGEGR